jgi:alanyl-tRNA synthetase
MAAERRIAVDTDGFEIAMEKQRTLARTAQKKLAIEIANNSTDATEFVGYDIGNIENIPAMVTDAISDGEKTFLVFDKTPFYAECGGQIGDRGTVRIGTNIFNVVDVQRDKNSCYLHEIKESVDVSLTGQMALLSVDKNIRRNTARNHSATHLLNAALRQIFGNHVKQAGSCVDDRRLRFDFSAFAAPTERELEAIEKLVEEKILAGINSNIFEVSADNVPDGCVANFGEKYGKIVRVVKFGDFSMELCGGCHVANTSEIACFKIISCSAIASSIRRIEAVYGEAAIDLFRSNCDIIARQCKSLSCKPSEIVERMNALTAHCAELERAAKITRKAAMQDIATEIVKSGNELENGLVCLERNVDGLSPEELRTLALDVLHRMGNAVVTLTTRSNGRCFVVTCCSKPAVAAGYDAGDIVKKIAAKHGGSGGGRPELAMGGYAISE